MATAKKKAPATVEKKTPYQGPNRCRGYFACESRHTWDSAFSWANYGQRCKKCVDKKVKEGLSESEARAQIQYTLPHSQEPLKDAWLYCQYCDLEEWSRFPKTKKCPTLNCEGVLEPWIHFRCPGCKYEHVWAQDRKSAKKLTFVCKDEAVEEGSGCDETIGIDLAESFIKTEPHKDGLCEKCDELGHKCTRHGGKGRKKGSNTSAEGARDAPHVQNQRAVNSDNNNNDLSGVPPKPERRKKRQTTQKKTKNPTKAVAAVTPHPMNELCQMIARI